MSTFREFAHGYVLFTGFLVVQAEQRADTEESSNRRLTDAVTSHGAVTQNNRQNHCHGQVEPIETELPNVVVPPDAEELRHAEDLHKVDELVMDADLQTEEELQNQELHPESMLEFLTGDCTHPPSPDANREDNPSPAAIHEKTFSVSDRNNPEPTDFLVLPTGSKPKGVSYHKKNKQWEAHIWIRDRQLRNRRKKGVQIFMGSYSTEDDAKHAHDRAAIKFNVRTTGRTHKPYLLNFPETAQAAFMEECKDWNPRDFLWKLRRGSLKFSSGKSVLKGVSVRKSCGKRRKRRDVDNEAFQGEMPSTSLRYEAKIAKTDGRKMMCSIGTYGSEEEAGKAYDRALLFINKEKEEVELWHVITNFRPSEYTAEEIVEAGNKLVFK